MPCRPVLLPSGPVRLPSHASAAVQVLTIHLQIVGIIMSINVSWPNTLTRLGSFTNVLTGLGSKVGLVGYMM